MKAAAKKKVLSDSSDFDDNPPPREKAGGTRFNKLFHKFDYLRLRKKSSARELPGVG